MLFNLLKATDGNGTASYWARTVKNAVSNILVPILIIACSVGMIYAIIVGIKMMKADSKDQREEAKAKLINIAISMVAIAVLIGLFYAVSAWLDTTGEDQAKTGFGVFGSSTIGNTLSLVKQCARMIVFKC